MTFLEPLEGLAQDAKATGDTAEARARADARSHEPRPSAHARCASQHGRRRQRHGQRRRES
jgi:hypothetical protein